MSLSKAVSGQRGGRCCPSCAFHQPIIDAHARLALPAHGEDMMQLPEKVIVTGAAQGIGRAVALRLAAPGTHVAAWDIKSAGVEETAKLCRDQGAVASAHTV